MGTLAGAGFAIFGQVLADRRLQGRERDNRREAFQIKQFEADREELTRLLDIVIDHLNTWGAAHHLPSDSVQHREYLLRLGEQQTEISKLSGRINDVALSFAATQYTLDAFGLLTGMHSDENRVIRSLVKLQATIGHKRSRNPHDEDLAHAPSLPVDQVLDEIEASETDQSTDTTA